MADERVVIIGAGIGGLAAAALLAARGLAVTMLERRDAPGGKLRTVDCGGVAVDAGPTVLTARPVFEALFDDLGENLADHLTLEPCERLARHAWADGGRLDLWADHDRSRDAIATFAGTEDARGFDAFSAEAARIWRGLESRFITMPRPNPVSLSLRYGLSGLADLWAINPFRTLDQALRQHFRDPRLRQLFGRYATYCGSSPYRCPATLALIVHLEASGVWRVAGGLHKLADALADIATKRGATLLYAQDVSCVLADGGRVSGVALANGERLAADAVIANCDVAALADDRFGRSAARGVAPVRPADRSLSALTWMIHGDTEGFDLDHHNVFFSSDYPREFDQVFRQHRLPAAPTVYVCAQDRGSAPVTGPERLQLIVNAPPTGDTAPPSPEEIEQCRQATFSLLAACGLTVSPHAIARAGPAEFAQMFPSTGGALYGRASHGWQASFRRQASRTGLAGLYCAGGSTHPGAGVPMATLSGRLAADALIADRASMRRSRPAAMPGGMSTPKATAGRMG